MSEMVFFMNELIDIVKSVEVGVIRLSKKHELHNNYLTNQ